MASRGNKASSVGEKLYVTRTLILGADFTYYLSALTPSLPAN
jgi:hypothetical protein